MANHTPQTGLRARTRSQAPVLCPPLVDTPRTARRRAAAALQSPLTRASDPNRVPPPDTSQRLPPALTGMDNQATPSKPRGTRVTDPLYPSVGPVPTTFVPMNPGYSTLSGDSPSRQLLLEEQIYLQRKMHPEIYNPAVLLPGRSPRRTSRQPGKPANDTPPSLSNTGRARRFGFEPLHRLGFWGAITFMALLLTLLTLLDLAAQQQVSPVEMLLRAWGFYLVVFLGYQITAAKLFAGINAAIDAVICTHLIDLMDPRHQREICFLMDFRLDQLNHCVRDVSFAATAGFVLSYTAQHDLRVLAVLYLLVCVSLEPVNRILQLLDSYLSRKLRRRQPPLFLLVCFSVICYGLFIGPFFVGESWSWDGNVPVNQTTPIASFEGSFSKCHVEDPQTLTLPTMIDGHAAKVLYTQAGCNFVDSSLTITEQGANTNLPSYVQAFTTPSFHVVPDDVPLSLSDSDADSTVVPLGYTYPPTTMDQGF